jgi:hypothetical protein
VHLPQAGEILSGAMAVAALVALTEEVMEEAKEVATGRLIE